MVKKVISVKNLVKTYLSGKVKTKAVRNVSFDVNKGDFIAIGGPSGSGKSTILYQIGLLDRPTKGTVLIDGKNVVNLSDEERSLFRMNKLGYVFQHYELLPELNTLENVYLPLKTELDEEEYLKISNKILDDLGLEERKHHYPNELSGGEQQRVSVARALVKNPRIILADEPTANLDSKAGKQIMELLKEINKKYGTTIIVVNHEDNFEKYFKKIIRIKDGKIIKIENRRKK